MFSEINTSLLDLFLAETNTLFIIFFHQSGSAFSNKFFIAYFSSDLKYTILSSTSFYCCCLK